MVTVFIIRCEEGQKMTLSLEIIFYGKPAGLKYFSSLTCSFLPPYEISATFCSRVPPYLAGEHTLLIHFIIGFVSVVITAQAAAAQQQKFRVTPHDFAVLEGSEALLRCEVTNLAGQVQWTKDGFALGEFFNYFPPTPLLSPFRSAFFEFSELHT